MQLGGGAGLDVAQRLGLRLGLGLGLGAPAQSCFRERAQAYKAMSTGQCNISTRNNALCVFAKQ